MLVHVSNAYLTSTVHSSLAAELFANGIKRQFVYCPVQKGFVPNRNIKTESTIQLSAPRIFNQYLRYFPLIKAVYSFVIFLYILRKSKVKPKFIIAHNLWSDGMVAYIYHLFTKVPYTVSVRNSDVNLFLPKLLHYRFLFRNIVRNSKCVIFINKVYVNRLRVISPLVYGSMKQYRIIYNGVADFWLDHVGILQQKNRRRQVIYIGDFSENKNLKGTVKALQKLQEKDITFVAIGGEKEEFLRASGLSELPSWIKVIARTCDKNVLLRYLSESRVFVMPSYRETFGLVYLEALSQGCCVVHSKDEGIDGIFDEAFICRVDPEDFGEISDRIGYLVDSYPKGTPPHKIRSILIPFSWSFIAKEYMNFIDCS